MKNRFFIFLVLTSFTFSCGLGTPGQKEPNNKLLPTTQTTVSKPYSGYPFAKIIPQQKFIHGKIYLDNYSWLSNKKDPDVLKYIQEENDYSFFSTKNTEELQTTLYKEFIERIEAKNISVPEKIDNYYYYSISETGKFYPVYCRKKDNMESKEEILLDLNDSANKLLELKSVKITPDHQFLAYSIKNETSESYSIHIKKLSGGDLVKDEIKNTSGSIEWTNDHKYIYYCLLDQKLRSYKAMRHKLGTSVSLDQPVFVEKNESFYLDLSKSDSNSYILLTSGNLSTTEVRYIGAKNVKDSFKVFKPRKKGVKYYLQHNIGNFFVMTNENAMNSKIIQVPVLEDFRNNITEIVPHSYSQELIDFHLYKNHIVVYFRENGVNKIKVTNLKTLKTYSVVFSENSYSLTPVKGYNFNSNTMRFNYSSFITPNSLYDYNMENKTRFLKNEDKIHGFSPENYQTEKIYVKTKDNQTIPVSMVYKKDIVKNGQNPLLLYGYGAYGKSNDTFFEPENLSLLDRGFIIAIAHVRGGGENGISWHESGKLLNKMNSFDDFISCSEYLINEKYTSKEKLVIKGHGAGGLLIGTVININPELFKVAIMENPFADILNTLTDNSKHWSKVNYDEFGNPDYKKFYDYISSYSPYDNITQTDYPNMLITANLNNTETGYYESAKFVAKMRMLKTDKNSIIFRTYNKSFVKNDSLKEKAFEYAFILDKLGIKN